ncbi:MAG: DUF4974 domain-containing protein [Cytophagia bacterium]|nr:MAG: DUF4974 domain-containing protein [Cytophagales bacterium]TAG37410.1 MAG: DUF4974 domain-containing protein [Cytophagia bacterium]TAG50790.1 MAG: DUF4974 domain-containing protein [Runella slithyformis]TAG72007.1 MAG: DUF4974 domain-containing protein [Runella slithyformis]TAG78451.1 MAG: DUF4974 domain-containing protein [Cytophagales bacterium]
MVLLQPFLDYFNLNTANNHIPDDLLARYLNGTLSDVETANVVEWLSKSPENAQELARFQLLWAQAAVAREVNIDAAWHKVKSEISKPKAAQIKPLRAVSSPSMWLKIAAALVLAVGMGWLAYQFNASHSTPPQVTVTLKTNQNTLEQILPDGSKVFLNYHTTLVYELANNQKMRKVALTGEAFFNVKRDESTPFVIQANSTQVRVLGTSFNVRAYNAEVGVEVESGRVEVAQATHKIQLTKQESAVGNADTLIKILKLEPNTLSYRTQVFVFEKTTLANVVASLRSGYHADIQISKQLNNCQLTARFERESLDTALTVIAETLNLKLTRKGRTFVLDGGGCQL